MAYGSPSEIEDIPAYLADIREGKPVSEHAVEELVERYRRIGGRSPLDEVTEAQRAALEAELGMPVDVGHEALAAAHRRGGRGGARRRRRADRRARARAALLAAVDRRLPLAARGRARRPGRARLRRELARPRAVPRRPRRARARHRRARGLHRAQPSRADPARRRPVPRPAARDLAARGRARGPRELVVRVPERERDGRALARARHPRGARPPARRRRRARCSSARSASSPTTSRSSGTSTSRRRERAAELGLELEPDRVAERRSALRRARSRSLSESAFQYAQPHETGTDRRGGRRAGASASIRQRKVTLKEAIVRRTR